ncbi:mitotic checkpoint protein BUB3.3 isoform X1 [Vitis riparia]|uniref:mitotic checkpoint protein BUB3.3 isoform X1 n=1 Tax=Vitis riparia TaxID=96939 RepID=UPI00155A664A|nr:mitotic checkpoint protein BUB3.3 isoform X1 [Vitis riparia]
MEGSCLQFQNPIRDAISRIRFAPQSNNLLISSWDCSLRLYDVDGWVLRLEAPTDSALLDCCFQNGSIAFSAGSDCYVRRYDLHSGIQDTIGNHDDLATCVEYCDETCQVVSAGWDNKIMLWDTRMKKAPGCVKILGAEVESMSLSVFNLLVSAGASVNTYDLRMLERPAQAEQLLMGVQIKCLRSIPNSKGFAVGSIDGRVTLQIPDPSNSNGTGYSFRCHPKSKKGRDHLVAVNDIVFNPIICSAFVTCDDEGYVCSWDAQSRRRLFELPKNPNSVVSSSYNHSGQLLAVASSCTYQEGNEKEESPRILVHG